MGWSPPTLWQSCPDRAQSRVRSETVLDAGNETHYTVGMEYFGIGQGTEHENVFSLGADEKTGLFRPVGK